MSVFRRVLLLVRDVPAATKFYTEGLGLTVRRGVLVWSLNRLALLSPSQLDKRCCLRNPLTIPVLPRTPCRTAPQQQAVYASETFTELRAGPPGTDGPSISLSAAQSEAHVTTGYSPHLHFDIADMDSTIVQLLQLGAVLDGTIKYDPHGKMAAVRAPDGHMIGLYEPAEAAGV
jgi:catechol 2,3-dioxygenase-like lactoylglutathione lyase family enzyme